MAVARKEHVLIPRGRHRPSIPTDTHGVAVAGMKTSGCEVPATR